jgi:uncharacterized protein (TIGR03437 family)
MERKSPMKGNRSYWPGGNYHLGRVARLALTLAVLPISLRPSQPSANPALNALWVNSDQVPNPLSDPTGSASATLVNNAFASGVNMLYVSVYSSTPNSDGLLLYPDSDIENLINVAHAKGMQVYAASGTPNWPGDGCATTANPMSRMTDLIMYNTLYPSATFDGVILDVEPEPVDSQALLALYQCLQTQLHGAGMGLSVAVSVSVLNSLPAPGQTEAPYQQIVDLNLNGVVAMGYRNSAGTLDPGTLACTGNGVLCVDENVIAYANTVSQGNTIQVGLDTDDNSDSEETFYSMGQATMNAVAASVASQFNAAGQIFGGFAINSYQDSYLSGSSQLPLWPATNPAVGPSVPTVNGGGVVNSGSYTAQGVAPGSIVSVFGTNLAASTATASAIPLPTSLSDVTSVTFNNIPAGLYFVSQSQINAQLPFDVLPAGQDSGTVNIVITRSTGTSAQQNVTVAPASPGIFTATANGLGQAFAYDNTTGAIAAPAGAVVGSFTTAPISVSSGHALIIACTGLGAVTPSIDDYVAASDGTIRNTLLQPAILVGGVPAQFVYSVLSPQYVSEYQIAVIPDPGTPTGDAVPIQIQIGGVTTTDQVTIAVAP